MSAPVSARSLKWCDASVACGGPGVLEGHARPQHQSGEKNAMATLSGGSRPEYSGRDRPEPITADQGTTGEVRALSRRSARRLGRFPQRFRREQVPPSTNGPIAGEPATLRFNGPESNRPLLAVRKALRQSQLVPESPARASTARGGDTGPAAFSIVLPGGRALLVDRAPRWIPHCKQVQERPRGPIYEARTRWRRLALFLFRATCGGVLSIHRSVSSITHFASAGFRSSLMGAV